MGAGIITWLETVPLIIVLILAAVVLIGAAHKGNFKKVAEAVGVVLIALFFIGLAKDPAALSTISAGLVHLVAN